MHVLTTCKDGGKGLNPWTSNLEKHLILICITNETAILV
jgi:hypothetical protein